MFFIEKNIHFKSKIVRNQLLRRQFSNNVSWRNDIVQDFRITAKYDIYNLLKKIEDYFVQLKVP